MKQSETQTPTPAEAPVPAQTPAQTPAPAEAQAQSQSHSHSHSHSSQSHSRSRSQRSSQRSSQSSQSRHRVEYRQTQSAWAEVEPYCVLKRIWRNFWMVLMSAVTFGLIAYCATVLYIHPTYTCSVTFVVMPRNSTSIYQGGASTVTAATAEQFATLLRSETLLGRVRRLYGDEVAGTKVSASAVSNTNFVSLSVAGPDPRSTYTMCVGVLDHYEDYAQYIFNSVILEPVSSPVVPDKKLFTTYRRNVMSISAAVGMVAMVAVLTVFCFISGTVQTLHGAHNQVDAKLLVTLNHQRKRRTLKSLLRNRKTSLLISNPTTSFLYVETIHQLRAQIEHAFRQYGCKTFLLTSVGENEGKSTVAANLALSLARRHKKILLMDCDLRKSAQHLIFEESAPPATINSLLKSELDPEKLVKALHYRKAENLFFLFADNVKRHSAELLGSPRMEKLMSILRENFDYVIVDSSPMGFFTDSEVLSEFTDASVMVVRQDLMRDVAINDAIDSLSRCQARFLGFIFNDVHTMNIIAGMVGGRRYGYGYGYGRSYGYAYGSDKARQRYGYNYGYGGYGRNPDREAVDVNTARQQQSQKKEGEA